MLNPVLHCGSTLAATSVSSVSNESMRSLTLHILMILHLIILVQSQADERIYRLRKVYNAWGVLLLLLEDDPIGFVRHHLCLQSLRLRHDLGDAIPLTSDFVTGVAVAPRVIVDGLLGVDLHVFLAGAATVQPGDGIDYLLSIGR